VTGYLRAVNAHDAAAARMYLAPEYQQQRAGEIPRFEDWVANIVTIRLGKLSRVMTGGGLEGQYPRYRDLIELGATYDVVFRTESAMETSGPQTRFLLVGHGLARTAWLILSIGTGP
jgi:hypothetical protein